VAADPPDVCEICHFDSRRWTMPDAIGSLRSFGLRWVHATDGLDDRHLQQRPDPATWSIAEYTDHVAGSVWVMRFVVELALEEPGATLDDVEPDPPGDHRIVDVSAALERFGGELRLLHERAQAMGEDDLDAAVHVGGGSRSTRWALLHLAHDVTHHLHDVGRIRHRLGVGAPTAVGSVDQVSVSGGGVPKLPIARAEIGWAGASGDAQADRKHHGRPWQALSLWSREVIEALRDEGHPVEPGGAGENLTLSGLDWPTLRPGTRLEIGDVVCEISAYAEPCAKNARWFVDGDFSRMNHDLHPGWSRLYATVTQPGLVARGDAVRVEPGP
jgi:MOSC domain-containing protein YiiM